MAAGLTFEEQLRELKIEEVEETGEEFGRGSYGVVVEVKTSGLRCAGKKLHDSFFAFASPQEKRAIKERFVEECLRLGRLRHPNIVQLLGVHFRRGSVVPTLIMEYLPMTLSQCLERYPDIPDYLKNSVLHDVALGLLYLHQQVPAIIHRDLTANNVLLASTMSAKIADLGVARIVNLNPAQMTAKMTICPGTPAYMPPEALSNKPLYDTSLDCFSYGNLIVHTVVQNWPLPLPLLQADPQNPGLLKPLTEVERRAEYLEEMGGAHPLRQLAERCLHNDPRQRPTAARIMQELERVTASHPPPYANVIEMVRDLSHNIKRISLLERRGDLVPHSEPVQQPLSLFEPNVTIEWSRCADMPQPVRLGQAVLFDGKVYYGSCGVPPDDGDDPNIYVFDYFCNEWAMLPFASPYVWFAMVVYRNQLVLVGGWDQSVRNVTNQVSVWDDRSSSWVHSIPPMPTARTSLTAIGYDQFLVAAGGFDGHGALDTVEVFDGEAQLWHQVQSLPKASCGFNTVYFANHWYLMSGHAQTTNFTVMCASLPSLTGKVGGHSSAWTTLPDLPSEGSRLAVWQNSLVALGGYIRKGVSSSDIQRDVSSCKILDRSSKILAYYPHTNSWIYLGEMPTERAGFPALHLPTGELILIGGRTNSEDFSNKVYKARLMYKEK